MFDYTICKQADTEIFNKQCIALETNIPGLQKEAILEDVDGSLIQRYSLDQKNIIIYNDIEVDSVYIKSEIELKQFFK